MRRALCQSSLLAESAAARERRRLGFSVARSQLSMQFFRRLIERVRAWAQSRRSSRTPAALIFIDFTSVRPPIHRDVSANGVRVFSVCGGCGARLQASATLCDECAQRRSRPARPF
jgi:hypothetical protein